MTFQSPFTTMSHSPNTTSSWQVMLGNSEVKAGWHRVQLLARVETMQPVTPHSQGKPERDTTG